MYCFLFNRGRGRPRDPGPGLDEPGDGAGADQAALLRRRLAAPRGDRARAQPGRALHTGK